MRIGSGPEWSVEGSVEGSGIGRDVSECFMFSGINILLDSDSEEENRRIKITTRNLRVN